MSSPKVLLIGWELADWKLLHPLADAGYLPNVDRLINRGVIADVSAASWRGVATGRPDDVPAGPPLWETFAQAGRRCLVVRWPGSHPALDLGPGSVVISDEFHRPPRDDSPGGPSIQPESMRARVEAGRIGPGELNVNDLRAFVPNLEALKEDDRPAMNWLAQALADAATTQRIAVGLLESEPWDLAMVHFAALGAICRQFFGLSQEPNGVYAGVPSSSQIAADQMLGVLTALAGDDAIVCLCSGYGLFGNAVAMLAGPGIRADERLDEHDRRPASALDLSPTLCALAGVPVPAGVAGRAWNMQPDPALRV